VTDRAAHERAFLARDLRKLAEHHAEQMASRGEDASTWDSNLLKTGVSFHAGICFALASLRRSEGTVDDRRSSYGHLSDLLDAAESTCWATCKGWLEPGGVPNEGWPDTYKGWERRATMCLLLAEFIDSGDFNG